MWSLKYVENDVLVVAKRCFDTVKKEPQKYPEKNTIKTPPSVINSNLGGEFASASRVSPIDFFL